MNAQVKYSDLPLNYYIEQYQVFEENCKDWLYSS